MATETAVPFSGTAIATSQQYRDRYRPTQQDMVDDAYGNTSLACSDGGSGASINVQNGGALVQAGRYDLTGGPINLGIAANGAGSNRFDIVCLTYDAGHSPPIYSRIVQGVAGAGLPALTNSLTGVWDFPIAHYQKTPGGSITGLTDRRKFSDGRGQIICADDTTGTNGVGWFPPAPRVGEGVTFWPSMAQYRWNGSSWVQISGVVEGFQTVAFASAQFTNRGAGFPAFRFRRTGVPNQAHIVGDVTWTSNGTTGLVSGQTIGQLPAVYRPTNEQKIQTWVASGGSFSVGANTTPVCGIDSTGNLKVYNVTVASTNGLTVTLLINGLYDLTA